MCDDSIRITFDKGNIQSITFGVKAILNVKEQSALKSSLEHFLEQIPVAEITALVCRQSGKPEAEVLKLIQTFANESRVTLQLIIRQLDREHQILEVGAGLCLLSLFLKHEGFRITALEPALGGFGLFEQLKTAILKHFTEIDLPVLDKPAQALDLTTDGPFDLLFSNNVIEHIPEWPIALEAMAAVLNPNGLMVHACPNYTIPYEPHYGVPVFRHFPNLSRTLFLSAKRDPEIWDSLNFITCREIKHHCNKNTLTYQFRSELLYLAIKRIDEDEAFKQRHQGMVATLASLIMKSGLGAIIRRIPPSLSTPMVVEISRPGDSGAQ